MPWPAPVITATLPIKRLQPCSLMQCSPVETGGARRSLAEFLHVWPRAPHAEGGRFHFEMPWHIAGFIGNAFDAGGILIDPFVRAEEVDEDRRGGRMAAGA